jgi:hypothetical protein
MEAKKIALLTLIWSFLLIMLVAWGCVPSQKKATTAPPVPPAEEKEKRAIEVMQKMRIQAVSRRVGRWAVLIGLSDYKYDTRWHPRKGIPDLKYAHCDAKAFAEFLMSPEGGAFSPDHVLLLTDRKATVKEVRKAIGDFLAQSLEDDLVIIFFAGHGTPDPKNPENLYLLCHDTEPGNYYGTALPMWEIDVALSRSIRSKRVFVFADACHSAGVGGTRTKPTSNRFNQYLERLAASKEGVTKITASRSDELSLEREFPEGGHGVFTYYLLKGLKGEADENGDGFVTMTEGFAYLYDRVRSVTRHSQNPWSSAYVSPDIPLGVVDQQVLAAIKSRVEAEKQRLSLLKKPYSPAPPAIEIPEDSGIAVKLARAKLAKDEPETARNMLEVILARNDTSKPEALALKIELLLHEGDRKGAEDTEDLLVIPYPDHPAAQRGACLVYSYYLTQIEGKEPTEQIRQIEAYLKRHPSGLLEHEANDKLAGIRAGIRARYEKGFQESLTLAQGFIDQCRFERARRELDSAEYIAREALSSYGIALETKMIAELRLTAETEEQRYLHEKAYQEAKIKAAQQGLEERINTWQGFVREHPDNPYTDNAYQELTSLRTKAQAQLQTRYNRLLSDAKASMGRKNFARALEKLDAATTLLHKAVDELDISLMEGDIYEVRERHRTEAEKHRDYLEWSRVDSEAMAVILENRRDFKRRIAIYEDFQEKWPQNPYRRSAQQAIALLKQQMAAFMDRNFNYYFGKAKGYFIAKNYTEAYQSLENARKYATSRQIKDIDELARRYNAPPELQIVLDSSSVDWETPLRFRYHAADKEDNPVRVVTWDFGDGTSSREDSPRHAYAKWGGSQKERRYVVTLKATDGHSAVTTTKTLTVKRQDCVARDGRFCALANGTVLDTKTGLMWASKDNGQHVNWQEAKAYCKNYRGGGYTDWRMPTKEELAGLHDKNKSYLSEIYIVHLTELIKITTCCPWTSETRGPEAAIFNFSHCDSYWFHMAFKNGIRALPVRFGN